MQLANSSIKQQYKGLSVYNEKSIVKYFLSRISFSAEALTSLKKSMKCNMVICYAFRIAYWSTLIVISLLVRGGEFEIFISLWCCTFKLIKFSTDVLYMYTKCNKCWLPQTDPECIKQVSTVLRVKGRITAFICQKHLTVYGHLCR